jgi:hypothetical protein
LGHSNTIDVDQVFLTILGNPLHGVLGNLSTLLVEAHSFPTSNCDTSITKNSKQEGPFYDPPSVHESSPRYSSTTTLVEVIPRLDIAYEGNGNSSLGSGHDPIIVGKLDLDINCD